MDQNYDGAVAATDEVHARSADLRYCRGETGRRIAKTCRGLSVSLGCLKRQANRRGKECKMLNTKSHVASPTWMSRHIARLC